MQEIWIGTADFYMYMLLFVILLAISYALSTSTAKLPFLKPTLCALRQININVVYFISRLIPNEAVFVWVMRRQRRIAQQTDDEVPTNSYY